ncbi:coiled-coil domain-containing protein 180-like [Amphiura filiformis]|uniref:coiled-coil domain-containing protein 180-like n=1 Tax=Amphiura filiformis TaxID=82378 RepID=UPI003B2166B8
MHQELHLIADDLEPKIEAEGETIIQKLEKNDKEIEKMLQKIADDKDLIVYSLAALNQLWEEVSEQSIVRRQWIEKMDHTVNKIESDRLFRIRSTLKDYAKKLEKIAYQMPPDVQRLIEKESQVINQTILNNRRAYSDLFARLMKSDIEREKNHHRIWETRVADWRQLNTDVAIKQFTEYMQSQEVIDPPGVTVLLEDMQSEQKILNHKRLALLNSLRQMKPPNSTKTAVYQWNKDISEVCQQIEQLHVRYLGRLHQHYEAVCKGCLEQIDKHKEELMLSGVCDEDRCLDVIEQHFLPQIGERQRVFEEILEQMDDSLEKLSENFDEQLRSLFKFSQGAAHLWDIHELGLARRERDLQEQLEECRHDHDNVNQDMEANLDIIMDRLRQESSEDTLGDTLRKALLMLDKIQSSYEAFHKEQMEIVKQYPSMVKQELEKYDFSVCKFYEVDRIHPSDRKQMREQEVADRSKRTTPTPVSRRKMRSTTPDERSGSISKAKTGLEPPSISSQSPVPMAVKEVLSTAKGTTFYVLTVAGKHGISEEEEKGNKEEKTFLTETGVEGVGKMQAHTTKNVAVPNELFVELRKIMRMEFLNHLEEWLDGAVERGNSVVAAKFEELNSELDLRLHLHEPRSKRAELDIHNVRGAELVMHSERVVRHSKGISGALNDIKVRFADMQQEHNKFTDKFKEDVDAMESVFIQATKSATLVMLSHQVSSKVEDHMNIIRASLRQFRQYLDDTLQMLRESNARFIKSFKLFSDGGNFSPEEVDTFKKKLEKLANKIDSAEGFVMADLEGMEARRLEQATEIANKFEDRFKHHLFDLTFIEKLTRWLTNTQVKVKGEVAESNRQAQQLMHHLNTLERRIDACEKPNLDKEQVTPGQLLDSMKDIFQAFDDRAQYLHCTKHAAYRTSASKKVTGDKAGKVGFASDGQSGQQTAPQTITLTTLKANKTQQEDAAVTLIKNILSSQKMKARQGSHGDGEKEPPSSSGLPRPPGTQSSIQTEDGKLKSTLRPPPKMTDKDRARTLLRRSTSMSMDSNPRRSASGVLRNKNNGLKFDPKYYVFGEKLEKEIHYMATNRRILQESLEGLLTTADLYYRQKGSRPPTRPEAIHESFELCADVIVTKLQSYFNQADEYHNQCLQEFREQLERLEKAISKVPALVVQEVFKGHLQKSRSKLESVAGDFSSRLSHWDKKRREHKTLLRPTLGHPHNKNQLQTLCDSEENRKQDYVNGIDEHAQNLKDLAKTLGDEFIQDLTSTGEKLLALFDSLLTMDDVETGRVDPKRLKTSALIRRKQAGLPLEDKEYVPLIERGPHVWMGVPLDQLVEGERPAKPQLSSAVTSTKTTLGHQSTVDARNKAFQDYLVAFDSKLEEIEQQKAEQMTAETRWSDSWHKSVCKVKQLY